MWLTVAVLIVVGIVVGLLVGRLFAERWVRMHGVTLEKRQAAPAQAGGRRAAPEVTIEPLEQPKEEAPKRRRKDARAPVAVASAPSRGCVSRGGECL